MLRLAALFLLCSASLSAWAGPALAGEQATPITIGETHIVTFAEGDERQVNVFLPAGYAEGDRTYPVLYLIDGGLEQDFLHITGTSALNAIWGRSLPVIVVGIETKDRRAELIGSKGGMREQKAFPTAGEAATFRTFLRDTVKPMVEASYRTSGDDAVMGESLAGLFIVETWLQSPDLFDRYAAINPSLWWDKSALAKSAAAQVTDLKERGGIFLTSSNEGPQTAAAVAMVADAAAELGCFVPRPDMTHATAYHKLSPQVLQFLFPTGAEFDPEYGFVLGCEAGEEGS